MVFRLVIDGVRRTWRVAAFAVFQLCMGFKMLGQVWPSSDRMAWTLSGALFLSFQAGLVFKSRELYQLPVSRRTLWLARWWLVVTAPVVIAQLAGTFAWWPAVSRWPTVDQIVLSMTFGVLYCGCHMALMTGSLGRSGDAPATFLSTVAFAPIMIALTAAPFVFAPYLPHSFAEMRITSAMVILAMAVLTARGYLHAPAIDARPSMRAARRVPSAHGPAPAVVMTPAGLVDRLTGLRLVLWNECRKQLITFSSMIAMGVAGWAVVSRFRPVPALGEVLRMAAMLPFSSPRALVSEPIVLGAVLMASTIVEPAMLENIRSLRRLPMSSARLGCLPVALGLVSASMLWIVLLAVHGLVLRTLPSSPRLDLFIAFAALTASTHAIRFIVPGQVVTRTMLGCMPVLIAFMAPGFAESWRPEIVQPCMVIGGLLILAASWVAMRHAVRRSSAIYRQQVPAAGVGI